eukprot:1491606-Rhodomonas_salina.1
MRDRRAVLPRLPIRRAPRRLLHTTHYRLSAAANGTVSLAPCTSAPLLYLDASPSAPLPLLLVLDPTCCATSSHLAARKTPPVDALVGSELCLFDGRRMSESQRHTPAARQSTRSTPLMRRTAFHDTRGRFASACTQRRCEI